jgi:hypothetical protein
MSAVGGEWRQTLATELCRCRRLRPTPMGTDDRAAEM